MSHARTAEALVVVGIDGGSSWEGAGQRLNEALAAISPRTSAGRRQLLPDASDYATTTSVDPRG